MSDKIEQDLEAIDYEIAVMEAEKAGMPPVPTWDQLQEAGALRELQEREARRGVLPHLIRAAKIKKLELERARHERAMEPLQETMERTHARGEELRAELIRVQEELNIVHSEHHDAFWRFQSKERRCNEIAREIARLGEARGGDSG